MTKIIKIKEGGRYGIGINPPANLSKQNMKSTKKKEVVVSGWAIIHNENFAGVYFNYTKEQVKSSHGKLNGRKIVKCTITYTLNPKTK